MFDLYSCFHVTETAQIIVLVHITSAKAAVVFVIIHSFNYIHILKIMGH